jgi:hypothetical protein
MRTEIETITPDRAGALLQTSSGNRSLRSRHVAKLARDIALNQWKLTGDAIRIDRSGSLCDGHHRLTAIIKADAPITTMVIYDFPRELVAHLDNQVATRSGADALHFAGDERPYAKERAATIQLLEGFKAGSVGFGGLLSNAEMLARLKDAPPQFNDVVSDAALARSVLPVSQLAAVVIAGTRRPEYEDYADSFLHGVATGAMLAPKSPIHALREWAFREKQSARRASRIERINAIIHAWNAHATDKPICTIKARINPSRLVGSTPATFKSWA